MGHVIIPSLLYEISFSCSDFLSSFPLLAAIFSIGTLTLSDNRK